jgi:hypothetical protein
VPLKFSLREPVLLFGMVAAYAPLSGAFVSRFTVPLLLSAPVSTSVRLPPSKVMSLSGVPPLGVGVGVSVGVSLGVAIGVFVGVAVGLPPPELRLRL